MKKLMLVSAAIVASTFFSGNASALPGNAVKGLEAPAATVKVSCGCYRPRRACCGYYRVYTYAKPCYSSCGCGCGGWGWGAGFLGGLFVW